MKTIAVISAKGGVGKTTISANIGAAFARMGRAVVAVDLDPQNALRLHAEAGQGGMDGLARATLSDRPWDDARLAGKHGVDVVPHGQLPESDRDRLERRLRDEPGLLAARLRAMQLSEDAIVLIDTPPGPSVYTRQAIAAADLVVAVTLADAASYATLPATASMVEAYGGAKPRGDTPCVYAINQVDRSRRLAQDVVEVMRQSLGERTVGVIHDDESVREALACNMNVLDYDPHGRAAHDLQQCARHVLARLGDAGRPTP
ncbi:cellulose biosynthesis protein BcsQ [Bordetella sputigena]|uniref:cellulose biosynthesis protein BcsQ n=1 Tax=Bordetella sputigena TaxID=1416810 RepID=UPI0039EE19C1